MRQITLLVSLMMMSVANMLAQDVKVEFYTPSIVHVVKGEPTKSLVVTAQPGKVAVTKKGNSWASSDLIVRQDAQGCLTFLTAKGKPDCEGQGALEGERLEPETEEYRRV